MSSLISVSRECKREKSAKTWCLPPTASRLIYTGLSPAAASTNLLITTSQPTAKLQCDLWNIFEKKLWERYKHLKIYVSWDDFTVNSTYCLNQSNLCYWYKTVQKMCEYKPYTCAETGVGLFTTTLWFNLRLSPVQCLRTYQCGRTTLPLVHGCSLM